MALAKFQYANLRLAYQITLPTIALVVLILLGGTWFAKTTAENSLKQEAQSDFNNQVQALRRAADLAFELAQRRTASIVTLMQEQLRGTISVDNSRTMPAGTLSAPVMKIGDTVINGDFKLVDDYTAATGATATVFVLKGDEFIRITTTNRNAQGERLLGAPLTQSHEAFASLMAGKPYTGRSTVGQQEHLSSYVPLKAADGSVVGAYGIGYNLEEVKKPLFDMIRNTQLSGNGYAYVINARGATQGRLLVHPQLEGQNISDIADANGRKDFLRPVIDQTSGMLDYLWKDPDGQARTKVVAYAHSDDWGWVILGGSSSAELAASATRSGQTLAIGGVIAAAVLALILLVLINSRLKPLTYLTGVVQQLASGDNEARANLTSGDEVGELGRTFDQMIEERIATQLAIEHENEQLNASVLSLLQAVAQLAQKDLTVKVPVAEDVTGAVGDALNLLTRETANVLAQVTDIAADVSSASLMVKQQSDTVTTVAQAELEQVEYAAHELGEAARSMQEIATLAQDCNRAADTAIQTTQDALTTVTATIGGISGIRDTIRETEKRIKRLGERSQEISGAVSLINTIAERTHILALNASMHAASAGEAGRGFAVVADEVQRLAENARQATAQIATLVSNIQIETADAVTTMNATISQVVEGSRLAEQAGEQMKRTQETTSELVASVQQIAENSVKQAHISAQLLERAGEIRNSTVQTSEQLREQAEQTTNLVEYARGLMGAVRVFRLPE